MGALVGPSSSQGTHLADAAKWSRQRKPESELRRVVTGIAGRAAEATVGALARPVVFGTTVALTTAAVVCGAATLAVGDLTRQDQSKSSSPLDPEFLVMLLPGLATTVLLVEAVGGLLVASDPTTSTTARKTVRGLLPRRP